MMKTVFKLMGGGTFILAALVFLLDDDFQPWVATAKQSTKERLVALVDEHEMKINQSRQKIQEFENAVVEQAKRQARLETMISRLDRQIHQAESIERINEDQLRSMQSRLSTDGQVFTSSGQPMSSREVQRSITECGSKLEMATSRLGSLRKLHDACTVQIEKLRTANAEAPTRIRSLRSHCKTLETKVQLAKEMNELAGSADSLLSGSSMNTQDIADSLLAIDSEIDAEIAGVSTLLAIQDQADAIDLPASTDSLVNQIDSFLGTNPTDELVFDPFN